MSKLFVAVLAFSTASLAVGNQGFSLGSFLDNPKIKLLSNPGALAAIQEPITVEKVKDVLKEHALTLYDRVDAAEKAFEQIRDSVGNTEAKIGVLIEKYYLVGLHIDEQAKEGEELQKLYDGLNDEAKKVISQKLQEAAEAVEKSLYKPGPWR